MSWWAVCFTYVHTSWWMACSKCWVLTMARIFPAEFDAQYGVTISILDSHASTLKRMKPKDMNFISNLLNLFSLPSRRRFRRWIWSGTWPWWAWITLIRFIRLGLSLFPHLPKIRVTITATTTTDCASVRHKEIQFWIKRCRYIWNTRHMMIIELMMLLRRGTLSTRWSCWLLKLCRPKVAIHSPH